MKIKGVADAKKLVGQTWERDGLRRTVTRIERLRKGYGGGVVGNVYWKRPGGNERKLSQWLPYFSEWLSKAVLVEEVGDA